MKRNKMVKRFAAALMMILMLVPLCATAQEVLVPGDAVKGLCAAAGGKLLDAPCKVTVASPYGTQSVVLRAAASDSYDAVAMLMVGQELTAVGMKDEFYFVLLEDGMTGWLADDEVKLVP